MFQSDTTAGSQAFARLLDALQETRIVFESFQRNALSVTDFFRRLSIF
jgi:hypothetical protein